jgi:hypothetical protein
MKFKKKPVVVEAVRWSGNPGQIIDGIDVEGTFDPVFGTIEIPTLEGTMRAQTGDWIVTGIAGERYPCRNDIFQATYEPA